MVVGSLHATLLLRSSHSLKEKRQVIRSIRDRIEHDFRISVAEVGSQDTWQRIELGFAVVGTDTLFVRKVLGEILGRLRQHPLAALVDHQTEIY